MLQLVDAGRGQLSGHYEEVALVSGPRLNVVNAAVAGNLDGKSLVLTIVSTGVVANRSVFSGTVSEGVLNLSGGDAGRSVEMRLSLSTIDIFKSQTAALSIKLQLIQAAQGIDDSTKQLEASVARMAAYIARSDQGIKGLSAAEAQLKHVTQQMASALTRLRSLPSGDDTAVVRGQIDVAINQAAVQANQFHVELQWKHSEFQRNTSTLIAETTNHLQKCQNTPDGIETFTNSLPAWKEVCSKAPHVLSEYRTRSATALNAFEHAEAVWQVENGKQQSIIRSSDVASR